MNYINKTIAKVFCQYLGASLLAKWYNGVEQKFVLNLQTLWYIEQQIILKPQLLLTPLSKITDEHAIEVAKIVMPVTKETTIEHSPSFWIKRVKRYLFDCSHLPANIHEQLIDWGYAVPLRCLGGKTPIEAGLAIDRTLKQHIG